MSRQRFFVEVKGFMSDQHYEKIEYYYSRNEEDDAKDADEIIFNYPETDEICASIVTPVFVKFVVRVFISVCKTPLNPLLQPERLPNPEL